jgi:hypothetical protein
MAIASGPDIVEDGLVLYLDAANERSYPGSGTTWSDLVGSNNATLTNGPTYNSGNSGSFVFDGVNDYADMSSYNLGLNVNNFSAEFAFQYSSIGNKNTLISINYAYPSSGYLIRQDSNNKIIVFSDHGSETFIVSNTTISASQIYYATICQSNNTCSIYLNGVLDRTATLLNPILDVSKEVYLGRRGLPAIGAYLDGNMYNIKIYNRALTAEEIAQNFNATRSRYGI